MTKNYFDMSQFETFEERYHYLKLGGLVAEETFGAERYLNQAFYTSREWRSARNFVITRDFGCDLGIEGREIHGVVYVHHINPITSDDLKHGSPNLIHPDNLITVTHNTHNAIHYGDENQLQALFVERTPGDTKLW